MRDEAAAPASAAAPAPFLTEEQRVALDQALRDKAQGECDRRGGRAASRTRTRIRAVQCNDP